MKTLAFLGGMAFSATMTLSVSIAINDADKYWSTSQKIGFGLIGITWFALNAKLARYIQEGCELMKKDNDVAFENIIAFLDGVVEGEFWGNQPLIYYYLTKLHSALSLDKDDYQWSDFHSYSL